MNGSKLRVGLIGCGYATERLHIPSYLMLRNLVDLAAISDVRAKRLANISKKFNIPKSWNDPAKLIEDKEIDVVDVCTPPFSHSSLAIEAAKNGKHVLVEKPLAISIKEGNEMISAARNNNVKLCEVKNFRFFPAVQRVRQLCAEGKIGSITEVRTTLHSSPPRGGWRLDPASNSLLFDDAIHDVDLQLFICQDRVHSVSSFSSKLYESANVLNDLKLNVTFQREAFGFADVSWIDTSTPILHTVEVFATAANIFIDLDVASHTFRVHYGRKKTYLECATSLKDLFRMAKDIVSGEFKKSAYLTHLLMIRSFIESIVHDSPVPIPSEQSLECIAVLEGARKSLESRSIVYLSNRRRR